VLLVATKQLLVCRVRNKRLHVASKTITTDVSMLALELQTDDVNKKHRENYRFVMMKKPLLNC